MKRFFILLSLLAASNVYAATYQIDTAHTQVMFKIKHLGISSVTGRFDKLTGTFTYDPKNPAASSTEVTIEAPSINTNNAKRDNHLRSADFFNVTSFPTLTFKSKSVKSTGENTLEIVGDLEMHGIKKEVVLQAEFAGTVIGNGGKEHAAFTATTTLNRKDFGLKWNDLTETGGVLVGDEVKVTLEVEGVKM